jgi:hypothetical protein
MLGIKVSEGIVQEVFLTEYTVSLPNSVPKDVLDDFDEAAKCFNAQAYRACVAMCRRAIEVLADSKAARGNHIYEKLLDLKNRRILDQATYNIASGVRQFGGYGAHPQKDLLRDVDRGAADLVLRVAERLIKEICQ